MRYKKKETNIQNGGIMVKEEMAAYITSKYVNRVSMDKLSYEEYIKLALDESDKEFESPDTVLYDWSDVLEQMRRNINEKKI